MKSYYDSTMGMEPMEPMIISPPPHTISHIVRVWTDHTTQVSATSHRPACFPDPITIRSGLKLISEKVKEHHHIAIHWRSSQASFPTRVCGCPPKPNQISYILGILHIRRKELLVNSTPWDQWPRRWDWRRIAKAMELPTSRVLRFFCRIETSL